MIPTRVLSYFDDSLFIQQGKELLLISAHDGKILDRWQIPFARFYDLDRRAIRLLRSGIHALLPLPDKKVIIVSKKLIYRLNLKNRSIDGLFSDFKGSRPLFICLSDEGDIYFGEYFDNQQRDVVKIYQSTDIGESYQVAYTFPPKAIRHIHGIFHDPFTSQIWVTTGDYDHESAIWNTKDKFQTLEQVVGGAQKYRAVQLIFTKEYIYFGSDSPLEPNYLYRLDKQTRIVERLQEVQGSVFYGCLVGSKIFFATVAEPSEVNKDPYVYIWGSEDGRAWKVLKKYRKDPLPMKLFQYGQIHFPRGENKTDTLWYSPQGTIDDLTLQRMAVKGALGEK